ncbi:MAG: redoxin family protein [Candidatus Eremiobacteraeota bacterium]|nr:redoxin family protein [Candidatus Eremiobacteraeota bacterium]
MTPAIARAWLRAFLLIIAFSCSLACTVSQAIAGNVGTIQSFDGSTGWLNSSPLTLDELRGKIVLVDFWEYTCLNCLKALPYEKAWYERYKQYGFVIVGVHTPEFTFSGETSNVDAAAKRLGVNWPIVVDANAVIWRRYKNAFWPHDFLIDGAGRVVLDHVGEGDYQKTERAIQALIRKQQPDAQLPAPMELLATDSYTKPGAVCYPQTAEVYVGLWHAPNAALGNREGYHRGEVITYRDSGRSHIDGLVYLQGPWFNGEQAMVHARIDQTATDRLELRYHAIQAVSVLKPEGGKPITVYIDQDGKPLRQQDAGSDVTFDSAGRAFVVVDAPRAYQLVMNRHFGHHDLRLRPVEYGLAVYTFAFESCEVGADR